DPESHMQTVGLLRSAFINCGTVATVPSKTQTTPPPRANAIVGTARPTDATANNAIAVLRNMIILLEELSLPTSTRIAGGNRSRETLLASTSLLLNSARETPD